MDTQFIFCNCCGKQKNTSLKKRPKYPPLAAVERVLVIYKLVRNKTEQLLLMHVDPGETET